MFKKISYLLKNFDKIKIIIEDYDKISKEKASKKKVSIAGVPDEQKKYIEENFKIK